MINYCARRMFSFGLFMIYCLEKFRGVFKVRYVTGSPSDLIAFTCTTWCYVLAVLFASFFSSKIFLFEKETRALDKLKATGTGKRYSWNPWTENLNSSLNILQVASLTYLALFTLIFYKFPDFFYIVSSPYQLGEIAQIWNCALIPHWLSYRWTCFPS
jgi:hypothetical protein